MSKKILGIIPARAGSVRVKNKNFRPFAGTTLTNIAIEQALEANLLEDIIVTSDSPDVLKITSNYKNVIQINRPKSLSLNTSSALEYQIHALKLMNDEYNKTFDWVVIIQPTSPLRSGKDIDATIELFKKYPNADSAVSIVKLKHMVHPSKLKLLDNYKLIPFLNDEKEKTSAYQLPDVYVRNCAVYIFKVSNILKNIQYGLNSVGYLMPESTAIDINSEIDFDFAEFIYKRNFKL